jgi:serine protease Do
MRATRRTRTFTAVIILSGLMALGCDRHRSSALDLPGSGAKAASLAPAPAGSPAAAEVTPRTEIPEAARALTDAFAAAAAAIRPSVVRIDVEVLAGAGSRFAEGSSLQLPPALRDFLGGRFGFEDAPDAPPPLARGTGSGVIIDGEGHVLTNSHVVAQARKVTIILVEGRKFEGRVVGVDPLTDVAVVAFVDKPADLTLARLGDPERLRVGQWVLAVGSPLGLAQTVTAGIVSGLQSGRNLAPVSGKRVHRYIQTDAAINPGNSGGPLVNLAGEVLGINTFINVGPGGAYGYAIDIEQAAALSRVLIKEGRVRYPSIGVRIGDVEDLPPQARAQLGKLPEAGAVVAAVAADGPAAKAGLAPGDVIVAVDGKKVDAAVDVIELVGAHRIGDKVSLDYVRKGEKRSATLTLAELPLPGASAARGAWGMRLETLTPELARALGVDVGGGGAVVTEVRAGGRAEKAGLMPGDVIVEVDRGRVASAEDAARLLAANDVRVLRVRNANGTRFVPVPK